MSNPAVPQRRGRDHARRGLEIGGRPRAARPADRGLRAARRHRSRIPSTRASACSAPASTSRTSTRARSASSGTSSATWAWSTSSTAGSRCRRRRPRRTRSRSCGSPRSRASPSAATARSCSTMDYVIAAEDAYLTLPARKEGIIPGAANLRLAALRRRPHRAPGDPRRAAHRLRQPEGRLICDDDRRAGRDGLRRSSAWSSQLTGSGVVSAAGNRRALRVARGAARRLPPLHGGLRARAGALPLQPGADREPREELGRDEPPRLIRRAGSRARSRSGPRASASAHGRRRAISTTLRLRAALRHLLRRSFELSRSDCAPRITSVGQRIASHIGQSSRSFSGMLPAKRLGDPAGRSACAACRRRSCAPPPR